MALCVHVTRLFLCALIIAHNHATFLQAVISANTTLTLANSPYYLQDDVVIAAGVVVIIENGVHIYMNDSHQIECRGHIISGCQDFNTSSSSVSRGVDETQFVYFYGGEGIVIQGSGFGAFCNTQFDWMKSAIIDESDNTATFVDHCWFRQTKKALQLTNGNGNADSQPYYIRNSVFEDIDDSVITGTNVAIDNCRFDTFYKLFANTPSNVAFSNSELANCRSVCFELLASQDSVFRNNVVTSAERGLVIQSADHSIFQVTNNTFMNCGEFAVKSYHRWTVFENNVFDGNMHALFADENELVLVNNTFINNAGMAAEIQLDVDIDGVIAGNVFANNGGAACVNLVDISGGGRWLHMDGNIFRNNSCQNAMVAVHDNQFTRVRGNAFFDCTTAGGNVVEIVMLKTTSLVGNVSLDYNQFILDTNAALANGRLSNVVYVSSYHAMQVTHNIFHTNQAANYVVLDSALSNALRVSHNIFYELHSVQHVISLQNTRYDVDASYNVYDTDDNQTIELYAIADKMYDSCEDGALGQVLFCPWLLAMDVDVESALATADCECERLDLCTADNCVLEVPSTTVAVAGSTSSNDPASQLLTPTPSTSDTPNPDANHPSLRPSLSISPAPSSAPTAEFVGVVIEIRFNDAIFLTALQNSTEKTRVTHDLEDIILSVINGTVPSNCSVQLEIIDVSSSSNSSNVSAFDAKLSVCDEQTERRVLFLFDSGTGLYDLEKEILNRTNGVEPEITVNLRESEVGNDVTPSSTLWWSDGDADANEGGVESLIREHLLYLVVISGVLLVTLVIGIVQYCRYERNQLIKNHTRLVGDDNPAHKSTGVDSQNSVQSAHSSDSVPSATAQVQPGSIFKVPNDSVSIQFAPRSGPPSGPPYPGYAVYDPQVEMYRFSPSQVYGQIAMGDMLQMGGEANSNADSHSQPRSRHMHDMNRLFSMDAACQQELQGLRAFVEDEDEDNEEDEMMYDHHVTADDDHDGGDHNNTTKDPNQCELEPSHDGGNSPVIEGDERLITNDLNLARPITLK